MAGDAVGSTAPWLATTGSATDAEAPTGGRRLRLVVREQSLASVGIDRLEATVAAVREDALDAWFARDLRLQEVAYLRTCQRVVVAVVADGTDPDSDGPAPLGVAGPWTTWLDGAAVHRLYRIAAGLESCAPGEREIRAQIREVAGAVRTRHPRPILRSLLHAAADAAAALDRDDADSVADLGVDWLLRRLPGDRSGRVLVIGAGTVGRRAAERLAPHATVTVVFRSRPPGTGWADRWNVRALPVSELSAALASVDAVVAAAKTTGRVLGASDLPSPDAPGPRWFVDLGLPRNLAPEIGRRPGAELVDLDRLSRDPAAATRISDLTRAVDAAAVDGCREFSAAAAEPWIADLRRWAESVRREEWERAGSFAGTDSSESARAYERMSERLVRRLLAGPTDRLRALPPGPEADRRRRRIVDLFRVDDGVP